MDKAKQQRAEAFYERKLEQRLRSLRFELQDFFGDFPGEYDRLKELIENVKREEEQKAVEKAFEEIAQKSRARNSKA
ncbi:hypothetical protein UCDDS831_g00949 [Diplodia seriata]|uniref:Uncharacterized protein n=1 Tax=Diplodia seriata TaxID=420778 RepID=A0A0G2HF40_9PEZI|nr:hypothetical protein UCDDS831_g00949 [Diplodia seriata]